MAWRIHSWSAKTGTGEVVSPHFGPWPFGAAQNPNGTNDFNVGEEVLVELDGVKDAYVVRSVVRARNRADTMPVGTECPAFRALNAAGHGDMMIEEDTDSRLRVWVFDCCLLCTSDPWLVTFSNPSAVVGLDDDASLDEPWLRYATEEEVQEQGLEVPAGSRAYRIVFTHHVECPPSQDVFVVAEGVEAEIRRAPR